MIRTVLIADDEPLARQMLRAQLQELGCAGVIHEAGDGTSAIAIANRERPAVIFLDIVMPGATGLDVLERLAYRPTVIFTTAHDQYAVTAFELGALDYVLKPFARDRLERAIERASLATSAAEPSLLFRARETLGSAGTLSRLFVRDGGRIVPVTFASIERIQGADDYATIFTATKHYLVSIRLGDLENRLARTTFLRIHRSHLINLEHVTAIEPCDGIRVKAVMKSGVEIVASRTGSRRLRDLAL
jgi:two-component system LytT family response regulator